jgi:hypothetical protein
MYTVHMMLVIVSGVTSQTLVWRYLGTVRFPGFRAIIGSTQANVHIELLCTCIIGSFKLQVHFWLLQLLTALTQACCSIRPYFCRQKTVESDTII